MSPHCLLLPLPEYEALQSRGAFSPAAEERARAFFSAPGLDRVLLFGRSRTAEVLAGLLGPRVAGYVDSASLGNTPLPAADAVLVATSPAHYPAVLEALARHAPHLRVLTLFASQPLPVRVVVESQPRSGTGYTMRNLVRAGGLGYASVFREQDLTPSPDGLLFHAAGAHPGYAVKAHFTQPLHHPAYRFCPTLFLFSYFFDAYFSWGRLLRQEAGQDTEGFFLSADCPEWSMLRGHIPQNLAWLAFIADKPHLRYEEYYLDFPRAADTVEQVAGMPLPGFEPPRPNPARTYWSDDYGRFMDRTVYAALREAFAPFLERYYPEKTAGLP